MLIATLLIAIAVPVAAQNRSTAKQPADVAFDFGSVEIGIGSVVAKGAAGEHVQSVIVEFLRLTPEQVEDWNSLLESAKAQSELIRDDIRANNQDLRVLFEAGDPEPEDVGALVIDNHDLGAQLVDIHRGYVEGFQELLEEGQRHRLNLVRRAARVQPVIPAFAAFGLLPRR
jgi:hypothetical protein